MGDQPLPAHRGRHVPQGLRRLVGGPLRQAAGTLSLRRLSLPVTPEVGGDKAQVSGSLRRGCRGRRQDAERAGPTEDALPAHAADAPRTRRSRSTRQYWDPEGRRTPSGTSARRIVEFEATGQQGVRPLRAKESSVICLSTMTIPQEWLATAIEGVEGQSKTWYAINRARINLMELPYREDDEHRSVCESTPLLSAPLFVLGASHSCVLEWLASSHWLCQTFLPAILLRYEY